MHKIILTLCFIVIVHFVQRIYLISVAYAPKVLLSIWPLSGHIAPGIGPIP